MSYRILVDTLVLADWKDAVSNMLIVPDMQVQEVRYPGATEITQIPRGNALIVVTFTAVRGHKDFAAAFDYLAMLPSLTPVQGTVQINAGNKVTRYLRSAVIKMRPEAPIGLATIVHWTIRGGYFYTTAKPKP